MADRKRRSFASVSPEPGKPIPAPPPRTGRPISPILPGAAGPATDQQVNRLTDSQRDRDTEAQTSKLQQLQRKETYIWPEQLERLTALQRALNRKRGRGQGERITENTLIRVAVELLLSRDAELAGVTEEDLRQSLGL
jgi:hypothetical protein